MAEKEYIERGAAYRAIEIACNGCPCEKTVAGSVCHDCSIMKAKSELQALPAADVRPVVLCKDCMYVPSGTDGEEYQGFALEWPHDEWPEDNPCPCKCNDGWYSHKPKPDFFCANGKREES